MQIFHSWGGVAAFNPHMVQGSIVFTASSSGRWLPLDQQSRKVWPGRGEGWCGLWIYPGRVWTTTGLLIPPRGETWMWLIILLVSPSWLQVGRIQSLLSNMKESRVCLYNKYIAIFFFFLVTFCCCFSITKSCPSLWDPMDCNTPGFPVLHYLPEFLLTYITYTIN